jgi:hypothetical protein
MTLDSRRSLLDRLKHSDEVTITVTGRRTKRKFSTPVWFVLDREKVILVPMKGSDNEWYKDLAEWPQIELGVDDITIPFKATLIRGPTRVEKVLDGFRTKYKSMWSESYYTKRDAYVEVPVRTS